MSRAIETVVPAGQREPVLDALSREPGVVGIWTGVRGSRRPEGDLLRILLVNDALPRVLDTLAQHGALDEGLVVLSEPMAIIAPECQQRIDREASGGAWEEIAALVRRDTNIGGNYLAR